MNRFPLTIPQQGLWSGHLLNDDKAMFNTAECIAFDGKVEAAVLAAACQGGRGVRGAQGPLRRR